MKPTNDADRRRETALRTLVAVLEICRRPRWVWLPDPDQLLWQGATLIVGVCALLAALV